LGILNELLKIFFYYSSMLELLVICGGINKYIQPFLVHFQYLWRANHNNRVRIQQLRKAFKNKTLSVAGSSHEDRSLALSNTVYESALPYFWRKG